MATIVVVDSEPVVRSVVTSILRKAGHSVYDTGDFDDALRLVGEFRPDLVVTNVFLRGVTGHDAMLILKTRFPKLSVLMVSGLPDEKVISTWTGKTGFDVFPKPFQAKELLRKIQQVLEHCPTA